MYLRILPTPENAQISRRRLTQLFKEQVGMAPKQYRWLRRFQRVIGNAAGGKAIDWAQLALGSGYDDQAHLTHEFREFSGMTPTAWLARERPLQLMSSNKAQFPFLQDKGANGRYNQAR